MSAIEIFAFHIYFMTAFFGVTQAQDLWSNLEFLSPFFYFHLVDRPCLLFLWRVFCIIVFTPTRLPPLSHSVTSNPLCHHGLQHARLPCPSRLTLYWHELILQSHPPPPRDFHSLFSPNRPWLPPKLLLLNKTLPNTTLAIWISFSPTIPLPPGNFNSNLSILSPGWDFPGGSVGKESACNVGDPGSNPGLGRSPGEGSGNTLQYSCLENSMDREAWQATVHGVAESQIWLSDHTHNTHRSISRFFCCCCFFSSCHVWLFATPGTAAC